MSGINGNIIIELKNIHQKALNHFWIVEQKEIGINLTNCARTKGRRDPICDDDEIEKPDERPSVLLISSVGRFGNHIIT